MKYCSNAPLAIAYATVASSTATPASPAAGATGICGGLGLLNIAPGDLLEGVEPSDLRLCANHLMGRNRTLDPLEGASLAPMEEEDFDLDTTAAPSASLFEERACYYKLRMGALGVIAGNNVESQGVASGAGLCLVWEVVHGKNVTSTKIAEQTGSPMPVVITVGSLAHVDAAASYSVQRQRVPGF
ncbi:hypothetical protein LZL87_011458 [Fusarium oxysporum]|nr:hypothetical protein LZL87_011458 [Fusarium oxysporum]